MSWISGRFKVTPRYLNESTFASSVTHGIKIEVMLRTKVLNVNANADEYTTKELHEL